MHVKMYTVSCTIIATICSRHSVAGFKERNIMVVHASIMMARAADLSFDDLHNLQTSIVSAYSHAPKSLTESWHAVSLMDGGLHPSCPVAGIVVSTDPVGRWSAV